eukprot:SAG25_NODE_164_length_13142_cov_11.645787_14_plen_90_part_00
MTLYHCRPTDFTNAIHCPLLRLSSLVFILIRGSYPRLSGTGCGVVFPVLGTRMPPPPRISAIRPMDRLRGRRDTPTAPLVGTGPGVTQG